MRMTMAASIGAGTLALLLCLFALFSVTSAIGEVERLRVETIERVQDGAYRAAGERLVQLASRWQAHAGMLEMISSHDDVHEATAAILDAQVCLEMKDIDDTLRALEQLGMGLEHIVSIQRVSWRNLY